MVLRHPAKKKAWWSIHLSAGCIINRWLYGVCPHSYVTKDCSTRVPIQIDSVYCCNRYGIILHEREQLEQVAHPQAFTTVDLKCQLNSPQPTEISLQRPQTWWLYWRVPFTSGFNKQFVGLLLSGSRPSLSGSSTASSSDTPRPDTRRPG